MMKVAMALMGLFVFCGCSLGVEGPPGPPGADGKDGLPGPGVQIGAPAPLSGSRLEIRYRHFTQAGDDGSLYVAPALVTSLWDTKRGEYCGWQIAEDGVIRCLPDVSAGIGAFTDSACTTAARIFHVPQCGALGSVEYFALPGADACVGLLIHEKGSEVTPAGANWYVMPSTTCVESMYSGAEYRGWQVGPHVPPTEFQSGQARTLVEYPVP